MDRSRGIARTRAWGASGSDFFTIDVGGAEARSPALPRARKSRVAIRIACTPRNTALTNDTGAQLTPSQARERAQTLLRIHTTPVAIAAANTVARAHTSRPRSSARLDPKPMSTTSITHWDSSFALGQ